MTLAHFLARVIDDGIDEVKKSYAEGSLKREGAIAGFEACRGASDPAALAALLDDAARRKEQASRTERDRYWYYVTFHAEIEWTCNVVSAALQNQGLPVIVTPTARGYMKAASIVGVATTVTA
jgi:hypothetical protein